MNFHFDFGVVLPVNSNKNDAGTRQRPTGKRLPSDLKLITGAPLGFAGGKPQRNTANSFVPSSRRHDRRRIGARCRRALHRANFDRRPEFPVQAGVTLRADASANTCSPFASTIG